MKKKNKKKKSTGKIIIYLIILIILLTSIIGFLHYLKEKRGAWILTNEKLLEISCNIEDVLKENLKSIGFTEKCLQSVRYESRERNGLKWNLCIKEIVIPERITITKYQELKKLIYTSLSKTEGRILNFSKEEDKKCLSLTFNIGVLKYPTHRIIFIKKKAHKIILIKKKTPKIAIIIDDVGNNLNKELFNLNKNITLSILPFLPKSNECACLGHKKGFELMLHLPMEPYGYPAKGKDPGEGAILVNLSKEEIFKRIEDALKNIPYIKGVNNHMGSKATETEKVMEAVLEKVKNRNLYFIDSLTSKHSVVSKIAPKWNIPWAARNVFIDNSWKREDIEKQINKLIKIAKLKGWAIGIGHAQSKNTLLALREINSILKREDVQLVPASLLVR